MKTILAVDFDKWAVATFRANHPGVEIIHARVEDCGWTLSKADVVIGGPPCQDFSNAGKGKGKDGDRNGWPAAIMVVEKVRPRQFLFENVPGMMTEAHIGYTSFVVASLAALGYSVETKMLDAVNFGAPQFRNRLWIWGQRTDLGLKHLWPRPTRTWPPPGDDLFGGIGLPTAPTVAQALGLEVGRVFGGGRNPTNAPGDVRTTRDLSDEPCTSIPAADRFANAMPEVHQYRWSPAMLEKHPPASPAPTVQAKWFKGGAEGLLAVDAPSCTLKAGGNVDASGHLGGAAPPSILLQSCADPARTVDAPGPALRAGGAGHDGCRVQLELDTKQNRTRKAVEEPSGTVAHDDRRHMKADGKFVRRLTPDECARLMGCPDDFRWPAGITQTAKYRIVGNGMCPAIMAAFSRSFVAADPKSETVADIFCGGGLGSLGWHGRYWMDTNRPPTI